MFNHNIIELPKLERIDGEIRRYKTPSGQLYPSVTTILGSMEDKTGLQSWIDRVGQEEADRIKTRSARRGTEVHRLCESLVLNQPIDLKREMPFNVHLFRQLEKKLKKHVDNILGSELFLYSDKLKVAGACDLIADWDGVPSIVDFKTSIKNKREDWINNYFLQTTLYSYMFYERTSIIAKQIVVLIAVEEENEAQVFIKDAYSYIKEAEFLCKKYHGKSND